MIRILKSAIHQLLHQFGLDVVRWQANSKNTLLGMVNYPIRTILDIGANTGQSARLYRRLFPNAIIYCFEPLPDAYRELAIYAQTQDGKVKTVNVALGDENGPVTMFLHTDHSPSSSLLPSTTKATQLYPQMSRQELITVTQRRLDDLANELELNRDLLVKIDAQGFESNVIRGGRHLVKQALGCILEVSLQPIYEEQPSFKELLSIISELEFIYAGNLSQSYDQFGSVVFIDAVFTKQEPRMPFSDSIRGNDL